MTDKLITRNLNLFFKNGNGLIKDKMLYLVFLEKNKQRSEGLMPLRGSNPLLLRFYSGTIIFTILSHLTD